MQCGTGRQEKWAAVVETSGKVPRGRKAATAFFYWLTWSAYRHEVFPTHAVQGIMKAKEARHTTAFACASQVNTVPHPPRTLGHLLARAAFSCRKEGRQCTSWHRRSSCVAFFLSILHFLRMRKTSCLYFTKNASISPKIFQLQKVLLVVCLPCLREILRFSCPR